eukprot:6200211-Pleurochrysis_carterae.AAC.1
MPLVGGADLHGKASGDPTNLRFNRPYRASPTGLLKSIRMALDKNACDNMEYSPADSVDVRNSSCCEWQPVFAH